MSDAREEVAENLVAGVSVAVVGLVALSGYLGTGFTGGLAIVGFLLVIPLVAVFDERIAGLFVDGEPETTAPETDALAQLRDRYARGELSDLEFERRVERLLETEDVGTAEELLGGDGPESPSDGASGEDASESSTAPVDGTGEAEEA